MTVKDASPGPESSVLAPAATGVFGFICAQGGDADRIFGKAGLQPDCVGNPTFNLSLSTYCDMFEQAARQTQNDNFGLWFGHQFRPQDLGMLGYAAVSSPTVGSALENLVKLFHFHQQGSFMQLLPTDDGLLRLEYQIHDGRIMQRRQDAELSLGMFANIFRESYGNDWGAEEIHFEHPRPENWNEHEQAFNAPVYFSQKTNAILFKPADLDGRMPHSDLRLLSIVQACLTELGNTRPGNSSFADQVRNAARSRLPDGYPSLEGVAGHLKVSTANLQRRLSDENLTYKDLVEDIRHELAFMYLGQRHLSLSEIGFLLGYSELSAFSRAFRRWTGTSPRAYRDQKSDL